MMRHGVGEHGEPHTLEEIGKRFGVTRERIRQIEAAAHKRFLKNIHKPEIQSLLDYLGSDE